MSAASYGLLPKQLLSYDIEFVDIILRGLETKRQHQYNMARIVATAVFQVNSTKPVMASSLFELPLIDAQKEKIDPETLRQRAIELFKLNTESINNHGTADSN